MISVTTSLNRETNSAFTLLIIATDTGSLTGTGTVIVTVTDDNTQDPIFTLSLYQATIPEDTPLDTSVLQVAVPHATQFLVPYIVSFLGGSK